MPNSMGARRMKLPTSCKQLSWNFLWICCIYDLREHKNPPLHSQIRTGTWLVESVQCCPNAVPLNFLWLS